MGVGMATGQDAAGGGGVGGEKEERRNKVERLQGAIHGLLEENRVKQQQQHGEEEGSVVPRDQEEDHLFSLLSKSKDLESGKEVGLGDIAKDLNKIKRQNRITHILLGTVIVMTAVWQFNEVSFLLAVQRKLSSPFKSLGDMIKGTLKRGGKPMIEASPLPPIGIPDVTRTDLPMQLVIGNRDG